MLTSKHNQLFTLILARFILKSRYLLQSSEFSLDFSFSLPYNNHNLKIICFSLTNL